MFCDGVFLQGTKKTKTVLNKLNDIERNQPGMINNVTFFPFSIIQISIHSKFHHRVTEINTNDPKGKASDNNEYPAEHNYCHNSYLS